MFILHAYFMGLMAILESSGRVRGTYQVNGMQTNRCRDQDSPHHPLHPQKIRHIYPGQLIPNAKSLESFLRHTRANRRITLNSTRTNATGPCPGLSWPGLASPGSTASIQPSAFPRTSSNGPQLRHMSHPSSHNHKMSIMSPVRPERCEAAPWESCVCPGSRTRSILRA